MAIEDFTNLRLHTTPNPPTQLWDSYGRGALLTRFGMSQLSFQTTGVGAAYGKVFLATPRTVGVLGDLAVDVHPLPPQPLGDIGDGPDLSVGGMGSGVHPDDYPLDIDSSWDLALDTTLGGMARGLPVEKRVRSCIQTQPCNMGAEGVLKYVFAVQMDHTCKDTLFVALLTREDPRESWFLNGWSVLAHPDTVAHFNGGGCEFSLLVRANNYSHYVVRRLVWHYRVIDGRHGTPALLEQAL